MSNYHTKSHCKFLIKIHIVFVTKYRKNIINNIFRDDLLKILNDISLEKHFVIDVMDSDINHLHLLVDIPPQISVQKVICLLKQISTYRIYKIHRTFLKQFYWKENTLWSDGYFACSTGDASSETIRKYIEQQG